MPYIFTTSSYPTDLRDEVVEAYFKMLKEMPFDKSLGKEIIQVAVTTNPRGVESLSIMNVKEGKLTEAYLWTFKRMSYFQLIKGFEFKIRVWTT
ncbi:MAG: hypothetical protein ACTSPZ_07040, partial [Promethearchaeota archaeon]